MKVRITLILAVLVGLGACRPETEPEVPDEGRIQPYGSNPFYWQYRGEPVLLLGGSDNDNLFQSADFEAQLDKLTAAGGNYVRCTMSSRDSADVWAYARDESTGQYDLSRFNEAYWDRLDALLVAAVERDVIVQIEVWATFDFYDGRDMQYARNWSANPFNPKNNTSYSAAESGLPEEVPSHPTQTENPFFFTVPAADNNRVVLSYQEAFVRKLLRHTLPYGHVLYCMDNETSVTPEWGAYWARFIRGIADSAGVPVQTTEMWDPWDLSHEMHSNTFDSPEIYTFVDVSQNNHQTGEAHWENAQRQRERVIASGSVRPLNNIKVYGADTGRFGSTRDGIERCWRNVFGGMASTRFHRPDSGIGISETAQRHIRSLRMLTDSITVFDSRPGNYVLADREENEAYAMIHEDGTVAVFFPEGGSVRLQSPVLPAGTDVRLRWLDAGASTWRAAERATADENGLELHAPDADYWAVLVRVEQRATG